MTTLSTYPVSDPLVVLREEFDDWAILFHPETAAAVGINPVGAAIWKLLDGRHAPDEIARAVRGQFSDVPDSVNDEVRAFIHQLEDQGFVGYAVESAA